MDDRAVAPVVGKALESGLVLLYVALVTTALFGSVVPHYRTTAGSAVADGALTDAASDVEHAIPAGTGDAAVSRTVSLPATIRGETYTLRAENRTLVLSHPNPDVSSRVRLALPASVDEVTGTWRSGERAIVTVHRENATTVVRLEAGE